MSLFDLYELVIHHADADFFGLMRPGSFFINAARGEVVDEAALMEAMPKLGPVIIDTWNHEPDINLELMDMVEATKLNQMLKETELFHMVIQ